MSRTIVASDHKAWEEYGLQDYGSFDGEPTFCNQRDYGEIIEGDWYYISDEPVGDYKVIYHGSFGNYNSPGASDFTYAELYDEDEPDEYKEAVEKFTALPEYDEEDE